MLLSWCRHPVLRMPAAMPLIVTIRASRRPLSSGDSLNRRRISTCTAVNAPCMHERVELDNPLTGTFTPSNSGLILPEVLAWKVCGKSRIEETAGAPEGC